AEGGADQEDDDRDLEDEATAVEVGDLAPERRDGGRGQEIGGNDPREVVEAAEVADDAGQGGADDALVERGEEHAGHDADQHDHDLAVGQGGCLFGRVNGDLSGGCWLTHEYMSWSQFVSLKFRSWWGACSGTRYRALPV